MNCYSRSDSYLAGKSTLLQILAGKRLIKGAEVLIKEKDVFRQYPGGVAFLGTEWFVLKYELSCCRVLI